jgi:hypothetical protein
VKGYFASFMSLDKLLVDWNWAAASWQAKYKWPLSCRIEGFDAFYA